MPNGGMVRLRIAEGWIPWEVHVLAWRGYRIAESRAGQSAEKLAEDGGFGWAELIGALRGGYNEITGPAFDELRDLAEIP